MKRLVCACAMALMTFASAAEAGAPVVMTQAGPSAGVSIGRSTSALFYVVPSALCLVSSGASLTYNVEVTGEPPSGAGFQASTTWFPLDSTAVGLTASANFQVTSSVTGIRFNITSYTSGSLTCGAHERLRSRLPGWR